MRRTDKKKLMNIRTKYDFKSYLYTIFLFLLFLIMIGIIIILYLEILQLHNELHVQSLQLFKLSEEYAVLHKEYCMLKDKATFYNTCAELMTSYGVYAVSSIISLLVFGAIKLL